MIPYGKQQKITGKTQANGAQTFALEPGHRIHQIQFKPSATPSAGTMTFEIRTPGATAYHIVDTITLTNPAHYVRTLTAFGDSLRVTPIAFDPGPVPPAKSYSIFLYSRVANVR